MRMHDFLTAGRKLAGNFVVLVVVTLAGPAFAQVEVLAPPAQQTVAETLEDAWQIALRGNQRVEAGQ